MTLQLLLLMAAIIILIIMFRKEPLNFLTAIAFLLSIYQFGLCAGGALGFFISFIVSTIYISFFPDEEEE